MLRIFTAMCRVAAILFVAATIISILLMMVFLPLGVVDVIGRGIWWFKVTMIAVPIMVFLIVTLAYEGEGRRIREQSLASRPADT